MLTDENTPKGPATDENAGKPVDTTFTEPTVQAGESAPPEKVAAPTLPPEPDSSGKPNIYTVSVRLFPEEYEYLMAVLKSRQTRVDKGGQPLTRDKAHLLKQCIRFTLNNNPNNRFWVDDNIPQVRINT
jgi:hypothetical protein